MRHVLMILVLTIAVVFVARRGIPIVTGDPDIPGVTTSMEPAVVLGPPVATEDTSPTLTARDVDTAETLLAQDSRLLELVADVPYEVTATYPWASQGSLVGAFLILTLSEPITIDYTWPVVSQTAPVAEATPGASPDSESPPETAHAYFEETSQALATDMTQLVVLVDLVSGRVVQIAPHPQTDVVSRGDQP